MKNVLYINSCVREESRTDRIARALLDKIEEPYAELRLSEAGLKPLGREGLAQRDRLLAEERLDAPEFALARQFAGADIIVISAPFWDLSFPSLLKLYIENIYVTGIVSRLGKNGVPIGMCRAEKLYYVTTAGGPYEPAFSYGYIKTMAENYLGIGEARLVCAEMLDVHGKDAAAIVEETIKGLSI